MIKPVENINKLCVVLLVICAFLLLPAIAEAVVLYLEPPQGQYHSGDTFLLEIRLNSQGEYINAVDVDLTFPRDILQLREFSKGNSIISLWVKEPDFDLEKGRVSFSGGVPGGYLGDDGLLARVVFQAISSHGLPLSARVDFSEACQVLLNDGLGTVANLGKKGAFLTILEPRDISVNEWAREVLEDKTSPQAFEVLVQKDPMLFGGKYFALFSTTDKQSGMDYYEIKEGDGEWQRERSPYLLKDQSLRSPLIVRAVDKAGNQRLVYLPAKKPWLEIGLATFVFAAVFVLFAWLWRKRKNRKGKC